MTRTIALTGGIGAGKSTVARPLVALGAVLLDADAIVHELQAPGSPLVADIAEAFGAQMLDANGTLDRKRLADRVFADPTERQRLNALMHPRVAAELTRRIATARSAGAPLVVDILLCFETRPRDRDAARTGFDASVLVFAPRAVQIERTVARDGCTRAEAEQRIAAQLPIDAKRALADHVVDDAGSLTDTEAQARAVSAKLVAGAAA